MSKRNDDLFDDSLDGSDDGFWFPPDFFPDEIDDDDIETIHDIQDMIGLPISGMIDTFADVQKTGRGGQLRGVRFSSGAEALLWLFRRGIYLYSTLVKFPDGTWGVAIGSSEKAADNGQSSEPSLPF